MQLSFPENPMTLAVPRIMGILNITPDSFSDGGRFYTPDAALEHALQMIAEGADIIDSGGESTRPGAQPVEANEEIDRILPVIEAIRAESSVPISVDTSKPEAMRASAAAGASMLNHVRALREENAVATAAELGLPVFRKIPRHLRHSKLAKTTSIRRFKRGKDSRLIAAFHPVLLYQTYGPKI